MSAGPKFRVAFFTHECQTFDDALRLSQGGLGVVSRDDLYGYEQLGFPAIGITLWSSHGNGVQIVSNDREMDTVYRANSLAETHVIGSFMMTISGKTFKVNIREVNDVSRQHTKLIALDTDDWENPHDVQQITRVLYGGVHSSQFAEDKWLKICQQAVLGIGGILALRTLGYDVDLMHMNESHGAFGQMFVYQELLKGGYSSEHAKTKTRSKFVYTNHTPVEAGNPKHPLAMSIDALAAYIKRDTFGEFCSDGVVPMTNIAFELSRKSNGVADLHAAVIRDMYKRPEILGIRNGIYVPEWQMPEYRDLKNPNEIPEIKEHYKEMVYNECVRRARECGLAANDHISLDDFLRAYPAVMWARRWAGYKRMQLPMYPRYRPILENLLNWRKLSLVWGGSPHPDDLDRKREWNTMLADARRLPNTLVLLNYGPWGMRHLKAAADIWLNLMWYGREACGTSWMSAMLNCALNVSVLDGGVPEAKEWVYGFGSRDLGDWWGQYDFDAQELWRLLATKALPQFWLKDPSLYSFLFDAKQWAEENLSVIPTCKRYIRELYEMELPS